MNNKLYKHNKDSYEKVKKAFGDGEQVVGIVHATGTGKSFNALALAYENKDKKFIYVVPSIAIVEHLKEIITNTLGMDMKTDFPNLEFRTYQSLATMYKNDSEELGKNRLCNMELDYLVIDEFHHLGAAVWGPVVEEIINTHENLKVFGMTAYTVRDRGSSYERDMALDDSEELFSDKIVSRYDLVDAMMDGVLPKPVYKSGYIHLKALIDDTEKRLIKAKIPENEKKEYLSRLESAKKKVHGADNISDILKSSIKRGGKYIYFCPFKSLENENDIDSIMKETKKELLTFMNEEDIVFYKTTSKDRINGKINRDAFYSDEDINKNNVEGKLQIMFAINQYNEGVHAPNVDGVILGRGTNSDIVYYEQIGRSLSVNYKESPIIIDLQNNIEFIRELEDNLKSRVKEELEKKDNPRQIIYKSLEEVNFDITLENTNLFNELSFLRDKTNIDWMDYYELLVNYYNHTGHSNIPRNFKTNDGINFDESGVNLWGWVNNQKQDKKMSDRRKKLLEEVEFVYDFLGEQWQKKYELLVNFYKKNGHSNVPTNFKTHDGINFDENGINLWDWTNNQKQDKKMSDGRKKLLEEVEFIYDLLGDQWQKKYELLVNFYKKNGHSNVYYNFKTLDGMNFDENGVNLWNWVNNQRIDKKISDERKNKLMKIKFIFNPLENRWEENYNLLINFYKYYGHSNVSNKFRTFDGMNFNSNGIRLGNWVAAQRKTKDLCKEHIEQLEKVDFIFEVLENQWEEKYELLVNFYNENGHSNVSRNFKTLDGITQDENGVLLGRWLSNQKRDINMSEERQNKLKELNIVFNLLENQWEEKYKLLVNFYKKNGHSNVSRNFKTLDGVNRDENGVFLGDWVSKQRSDNNMSEEHKFLLKEVDFVYDVLENQWEEKYKLLINFYGYYGHSNVPRTFVTSDGVSLDKEGINLGNWVKLQRGGQYLNDERKKLLKEVNFIFSIKDNKLELQSLCGEYSINYNKNKKVLKNSSINFAKLKILFLLDSGLSLEENGVLRDIFSMSNENMMASYNISMEELKLKYSNVNEK